MSEFEVVGKRGFFYLHPIGYYLVMIGRCNEKIHRGFIGRVVYAGQPVACTVGPVVGKEATVLVFIVGDHQTIGGNTFVSDLYDSFFSCFWQSGQYEGSRPIAERLTDLSFSVTCSTVIPFPSPRLDTSSKVSWTGIF